MATRRNRKNGKFTRQTNRRRRTSKAISITNTAESLIIMNAVTKGLFGTNLREFADLRPKVANNSWNITLGELIGGQGFGQSSSYGGAGVGGTFEGLMLAVKSNLEKNGASMLGTVILTPIAFKMAKKVLAKPVIRPARKAIKMAGLQGSVKV